MDPKGRDDPGNFRNVGIFFFFRGTAPGKFRDSHCGEKSYQRSMDKRSVVANEDYQKSDG